MFPFKYGEGGYERMTIGHGIPAVYFLQVSHHGKTQRREVDFRAVFAVRAVFLLVVLFACFFVLARWGLCLFLASLSSWEDPAARSRFQSSIRRARSSPSRGIAS